ncbi:MAG: transfer agent family protein [Hyphomicrobiales bacterium]|nr:transfer agent family protein [Hyphomicrobiales bacterium]
MANLRRGEIDAELGGRRWTLCLTLGALAELESAFGSDGLPDLARRFESGRIRAQDLLAIIGCGLRGAGHAISDAEVALLSTPEGLPGYVRIVAELLAATFGPVTQEGAAFPPQPQKA